MRVLFNGGHTIIIDNPTDPGAFEAHYTSQQSKDLLGKIPGIQRVESAKVFPKEDGSPTPAYRTIDIYFPDYATAVAALESPSAGELAGGLVQAATGGIRFLLSDIED
ncbi:MAG: EthD family reductase [Trebonia sp.]